MAALLDAVPNRSDVLIDANIFVYGLTTKSAQCQAFLARCSREELTGIALFESVNNATHQFMKGEALSRGLCAGQAMRYLAANPDQVKLLTDYWTNTQRLVELSIVTGAQPERASAGLLTNDSIIIAAMRGYGVSLIASNDRQFDAVPGITVFSPTDIP
jgi:predicted nucleic acid-binding protein